MLFSQEIGQKLNFRPFRVPILGQDIYFLKIGNSQEVWKLLGQIDWLTDRTDRADYIGPAVCPKGQAPKSANMRSIVVSYQYDNSYFNRRSMVCKGLIYFLRRGYAQRERCRRQTKFCPGTSRATPLFYLPYGSITVFYVIYHFYREIVR